MDLVAAYSAPSRGTLAFKGALCGQIDPRMAEFFKPGTRSTVRLDEVDWGGVTVNGIPPLGHPEAISAEQARYLDDGNVVFGIVVNGEPRAYPKRIRLARAGARSRRRRGAHDRLLHALRDRDPA